MEAAFGASLTLPTGSNRGSQQKTPQKKSPKKQKKTGFAFRNQAFELAETRSSVQEFTRSGIPWLNTAKKSPQGRRKLEGGEIFYKKKAGADDQYAGEPGAP